MVGYHWGEIVVGFKNKLLYKEIRIWRKAVYEKSYGLITYQKERRKQQYISLFKLKENLKQKKKNNKKNCLNKNSEELFKMVDKLIKNCQTQWEIVKTLEENW